MGRLIKITPPKNPRSAKGINIKTRAKHAAIRGPVRTWRVWCATYAETGNQRKAAEAAGVSPGQHRNWMRRHEKFRKMFEHAEQVAGDLLEAEAVRRAREGVRKPVLYRGKQIKLKQYNPETGKEEMMPLFEVTYSDVMLMFLLRGFKPEKYGPKSVNDLGNGLPQYKEIEGASMKDV